MCVCACVSVCMCVIAGARWSPSGLLDLVASSSAKNNTPSSGGLAVLLALPCNFSLCVHLGNAPQSETVSVNFEGT